MVDGNYVSQFEGVSSLVDFFQMLSEDNPHYGSGLETAKAHGDYVRETFLRYYQIAIDQTVKTVMTIGFEKLVDSYDKEPAIHNTSFDKLIEKVRHAAPLKDETLAKSFAVPYVSCIADSIRPIVISKTSQVLAKSMDHVSKFNGSYNIPVVGVRDVAFNGNYALAHPKTRSYYLAHAITISSDGEREPTYYAALEEEMAKRNIYGFRPALYRPSSISACLVLFDLVAILHCDNLIMDLTNGLSVGATVEANFAFLCDKQIIAIGDKAVPISEFVKTLARNEGNVMHSAEGLTPDLVAEIVCRKACEQNGRWY